MKRKKSKPTISPPPHRGARARGRADVTDVDGRAVEDLSLGGRVQLPERSLGAAFAPDGEMALREQRHEINFALDMLSYRAIGGLLRCVAGSATDTPTRWPRRGLYSC